MKIGLNGRYKSNGCWNDGRPAALKDIDADIPASSFIRQLNPISNCFEAALIRKFVIFAVQNGKCFGGNDLSSYKKYGMSTKCKNGHGAALANDVYEITTGDMNCIKILKKVEIQSFTYSIAVFLAT